DRDLRKEQPLGEGETDRTGAYRIEYSERQFLKRERDTVDLVVKALGEDGSVLIASPVLFNAPQSAEINLTIPPERQVPPTLLERIESALEPLLGGVKVEKLEENQEHQDLTFLSGETGFEKPVLARFVLAHGLVELGIDRHFWFALLGAFFEYAPNNSLKDNLATLSDALPTLDARTVRKALSSSFNSREIPARLEECTDEWTEAFLALVARLVLGDGKPPTFVKLALDHAGIQGADKRARFARLFNQHKKLTPDLLAELEKDRSFKKAGIADLRTSYQLGELTQGGFSVVKVLKEEFNIRRPEQIRTLAKQSEREWVELIGRKHEAGEIELPLGLQNGLNETAEAVKLSEPELYGKTLERRFRDAFPTAAFAGGLERALHNGGAHGVRDPESLARIIERHPEFDLLSTPVDEFLSKGIRPELHSLARDESLRLELKAVQRVFKLTPTFDTTDTLLADGLHSAQMVYRLGESEFVRRYANRPGFSEKAARLTWSRAADTHAAVLTVIGDLKALDAETLPAVLKNGNGMLAKFPNWENLFQSGDICHCEDCRSVLSPAAYFTDLLMFLRDRASKKPGLTVKDVLFNRRPDLGYLELNCENALTTLPYVDVVCEVLERVVAAGENDIELVGFDAVPAGSDAAKAAAGAALSAAGIAVGPEFTLSQVDHADPERWVVHGDSATYLLKKKATPNFFAELLPNTKASSEELRAYPANVNPKAYVKLADARFPLGLPFDLFAEEVRAAFQKCNLQRWDLMRTLRGPSAPNDPTDGDIGAEYFGVSCDAEKDLILSADPSVAGQQAVWGEAGNAGWLNKLKVVKTFLHKSGLEYNELLALLDLRFINPGHDAVIQHLDASCNTGKKVISGLDAARLDRIHRFLRLWRKLSGWKMWELDLAISSLGSSGDLDEPFLVNLYYLARLKTRLGGRTTVEQLCALFADLCTETHFTAPHQKRADGLYANLFLNKKLIQPLDPAFEIAAVKVPEPTTEKISGHRPAILAALTISEGNLDLLAGLTRPANGPAYITDDLTLANLSFLWRQAWLGKQLKFKAHEWKTVLGLLQQDVLKFADPKEAFEFVEKVDQLRATGFTPDQLNWLLAADRSAKAAVKEGDAVRFLASLRTQLQALRAEYDSGRYEFLDPPSDIDRLTALLTSLLEQVHRDEAETRFLIDALRDEVQMEIAIAGLPPGFDFPTTIKDSIRIRHDETAGKLRFSGLMTSEDRAKLLTDSSLSFVTGNADYQRAINEFFDKPRLAMKFLDPLFTAPLASLPESVNLKALPDPGLARKISYDAEGRVLRAVGILSFDEKGLLDAQSADPVYRNAVNSLFSQPRLGVFPPEERWLLDADLQVPLPDKLKDNLALAVTKALGYLSRTLSDRLVIREASAQLGLTEELTRRLLIEYAVSPGPLLSHFTGAFADTVGVVDYSTLEATFDGWFWANRVAGLWKKWKLTLPEWERLQRLTSGAQLLDFADLPLKGAPDADVTDKFLRTSRLLRLRDALPETGITFLEVLDKLNGGEYPTAADFAGEMERVNEAWSAADVLALIDALDLTYPGDYLLAENWERIRRVFYFTESLNAGADKVKQFAAAKMTEAQAKELKALLRSKLGGAAWLTLSAEIQDALRERKRDALAAYLLTQPQPADAPSGKWENTNDLYAYYLLDVEMSACQLTSRLVQASGSVQLFVQRCFMGLEPDVAVMADGADGDSAWRWWKWMRKFTWWKGSRQLFLWPENWIEPELKKDRSPFFKDLENDLLQREVNQYTVETAFGNYLEKLDSVAQLEIAGFYQEDDGDIPVIHVFGRTPGAEPHGYYYRRYDYRQWTAWEKVNLDIPGDYLIPAVVNKRLFLFWPVFSEVADETSNSKVSTPQANQVDVPLPKTSKKLKLQMAVSEYRQGNWTPKKVSKDFYESTSYNVDIVRKFYRFYPVDRTEIDGRFAIKFDGWSLGSNGYEQAGFGARAFEIAGCKGVPERTWVPGAYKHAIQPEWASIGRPFNTSYTAFMRWIELGAPDEFGVSLARHDAPQNDFTLENTFVSTADALRYTPVLNQTPWTFRMSPPWHLSYFDKLVVDGLLAVGSKSADGLAKAAEFPAPLGTWLPFFYNDKKRTFFVLPTAGRSGEGRPDGKNPGVRNYYPEIRRAIRQLEDHFAGQVEKWIGSTLPSLTSDQRKLVEQSLVRQFPAHHFPDETLPPETDEQLKKLMKRFLMRFFHFRLGALSLQLFHSRQLHFKNFYHPFVCDFAKLVYNPLKGIPALMSRATQLKDSGFSFRQSYQPTAWVVEPPTERYYPREIVDFSPDGAYSPYNWELFFHAPLLIANSLSKNQRFEEARDWYHLIFNPIGVESSVQGGSVMSKYWITKPFFETTKPEYVQQRIENILHMLAGDTTVPGYSFQARKALEDQVFDWRTNPFEPHRIANYRTVAYQKTVVMKYLDNLIAWGDYLFGQDSMESINEATQLYVLAAELLGPRPKKIPPHAKPPLESFNELEKQLDAFSNALIEVENLVPPPPGVEVWDQESPPLPMLYFCIPHNEKMLRYWDTVADRLYKIRHCMNIEGVVRQLALFERDIDPGDLVKAVAAGVDIGTALADLDAPLPLYRFNVLLQKANEVCNDVKALGAALLSALEKKDGEALGLLRQSQEIRLMEAVKAVRERQIEEAKENLESLRLTKATVEERRNFYRDIDKISGWEYASESTHLLAVGSEITATILSATAGTAHLIPKTTIGASGFGGTPHVTVEYGGENVGKSAFNWASFFSGLGGVLHAGANLVATRAGYERRWDEWKLQERLADKELVQLDRQLAAAELRVSIAEKELENHISQIENAKAVDAFMRSKYTNEELYQWQVGQISGVYFQTYKLAYDLAKRAERCFRFELGLQDSSFISFGYWDSLKKGLLCGEKLHHDLRSLESAYLEQNRREFELTKHISLVQLNPLALVQLRETGRCSFQLPEELFDLDYPGHYFRRIKWLSMTLPCVAGPYTTISCTLRLLKNNIRINTNGDNGYPRNTDDDGLPADDPRFVENNIPVKAVAVSSGQNDSGVFELNFRDERYLPFEGAGAISEWSLELFNDGSPNNGDFGRSLRQFDYNTITDAVLHVRYTAREEGGAFKDGAIAQLRTYFSQDDHTPSLLMLNLRRDFPTQWSRFLNPVNPANGNVFELEMSPALFPIRDTGKVLRINTISFLARCADERGYDVTLTPPPPAGPSTITLDRNNDYGGLHFRETDAAGIEIVPTDPPATWRIRITNPDGVNLTEDPVKKVMEVEDVILVIGYQWVLP
ncbi:MAG: hypothetical protein EHM23_06595, partial [Acidobacteria bacterium]